MKKILFVFLICVLTLLLGCGCSEPGTEGSLSVSEAGSLTLMTWNVHNLFDGSDNGFEYDEFLQSAGWSVEKYMGRLTTISDAIGTLKPLPDVIVFQEIESLAILEDLAVKLPGGYAWSHFASNPGAGLGLGVLSRLPLADTKTHSITVGVDTTPRPVLESRVQTKEGDFILFACHWKSKLGGDDQTENVRRASARVILRRMRELWEEEPELGVIVAGDLNENHDEFYRRGAAVICALMPDDPYCAQLTESQRDFFVLSKSKPPEPVHFPPGTIIMYSPWSQMEKGSYYYRNNWETIDHFLVSSQFFNNRGWEYEKMEVVNYPPFANATGTPIPYSVRTGAGLSDHLPLLLRLKITG